MRPTKFKIRSQAHPPQNPIKITENSEMKAATTTIEKIDLGNKNETLLFKNGLHQSHYPATYLEPRDRHILVDNHRSEGCEIDDQILQKWMGSVCRDVMSTAFNSYISQEMTYQQSQIYVCQQILGNIAVLSQKAEITPQLFEKLDNILKQKILPYLAMKYPLSQSTDIYRNLNQVVKQINNIEVLSNDFLYNSNIVFQYRENGNYTDLIMQVVNQLISSTDELTNDDENGEQKNNYYDFTQFMTNQFEKVYDFDWISERVKLMKNSTIRISKQQQNNARLQQSTLQKLRYKQKVQQYTHYEIGRKIPQSMAKYNEQQISNGFMQIKSPQILRILTKWCEQLWQKFQNECYYVDRTEGISMTRSKQINIIYEWLKRDLKPLLAEQKIAIIQYMKDVETNLYQQQFKIIQSELLSKESPFLQRYERICGKFAVKVVRNLQNCIIIYLNRLIHGLMKVSKSIFIKLNNKPSWPYPPNLISLKIGDLLRCRIFSKQNEIKAVYELFQSISEKQPDKLRIIRVKNRLKLGTNDILINVRFNNTLTAEIQLKVKAQKSQTQFSKCSFNFSHFIYEMSRSQFGPISEMCSIWNNLQRRSSIYQQLVNNQNLTQNNSLQKESYCLRNSVPHMMLIITNNPFICNSCGKSYSNDNFILPHTACKNCRYYQCALCCINHAKGIDLIEELIQDTELSKYLFEQRCINKIPTLGVMIPIRSRLRYIIRFKIIELLGKKYVFRKNGTEQFQLEIELKDQKEIKNFLNNNLVFQYLSQESQEFSRFTIQIALREVILPNYVKNCFKTKKETIALTKMGGLQLKGADFEQILVGHKQSKSYIKHFQASNQSLQNVDFLNEDFCNLQLINLNINKMNNFDALTKFTKLNSLFLGQNTLQKFPIQICCIPLRYLSIATNKIKMIPPQIEKITTLEVLKMNSNTITQFPIELTRLPNLKEIYANKNNISLLPEEIGNCLKLEVLQMQNNMLESLPLSMENLVALHKLDVKGNRLLKIQINLAHLKRLKQFVFCNNKMTNLPSNSPSIFCHSLNLSNNELGSEFNISNIQMPNLKTLLMQQCDLVTLNGTKAIQSVSELNIRGNDINALPNSFAHLQNLRILHANQCNIVSIDEICNIRSLRELYLQQNRRLLLPQKISFLKLTTLNISSCNLNLLHSSICRIKTLKNLYISSNGIVSINPDIRLLRQLLILDISGNNIKVLPKEINNLINLKTFAYNQNQKCDTRNILQTIFRLELKQIRLIQQNLEQIPQDIGINKSIYELSLERNVLKYIPSIIIKLPYLKTLHLGSNQIKVVGEHLFSLISLGELFLNNNLIEELPDKFDSLKKLIHLDIDYNKLKQLPRSLEGLLINGCKLFYKNNQIAYQPLWFVMVNYQNNYMNLENHELSSLPRFSPKHNYINLNLQSNKFQQIPRQLELLKISIINLNNNKIRMIPEWLLKNELLINLFLSNNLIEEIPNLTTLKKLCKMSINGNPIKKIDPSISFILFQLFSLSGSTIDLLALADDKNMKLLESQQLHIFEEENNQITSNISRLKIKMLIIKSSKVETLPKQIGLMTQLIELNIQMPLKQLPLQLAELKLLLRLTIKSNRINSFPLQIIQCKSLGVLRITESLISQIPQQISQLNNLQNLYLSHNKLRNLSQKIQFSSKLYEIDLSHNQLTEIPKCLQKLEIKRINLSFNKIEAVGVDIRKFNTKKRGINMKGNPITKVDDVAMLQFCDEETIEQFKHLISQKKAI